MWVRLLMLMILMVLALVPFTARAEGVLVLGDSISAAYGIEENQGWVQLLRQRLEKQCSGSGANTGPVHNASVSGDTSDGGLVRLPRLLENHQPEVVIIELGGNDGLRGLPPQRLEQNLIRLVALTREADAEPVLLGMRIPPNYGRAYTQQFEAAFSRVAEQESVPFVPFLLEGVVEADQLQGDGVHPTADAQPRLLDTAWPTIREVLDCDG